jgi:hypothetical protein
VPSYHIWYEPSKAGENKPIVIGSGPLRNVFFGTWGDVHNKMTGLTSDAVILYDADKGEWNVKY